MTLMCPRRLRLSGHANYRHGRAHGRRGINFYWRSVRESWVSVPGLFGMRIGHRL